MFVIVTVTVTTPVLDDTRVSDQLTMSPAGDARTTVVASALAWAHATVAPVEMVTAPCADVEAPSWSMVVSESHDVTVA